MGSARAGLTLVLSLALALALALGCDLREAAPSAPEATSAARVGEAAGDPATTLSIATLNLRWFPDGDLGASGRRTTDVDTLALHLSELDAPVIAVQEVLTSERARRAMDRLRERLSLLTRGRWELELDDCPDDEGRLHVGLLYDASRIERLEATRIDALAGNTRGDGCAGFMRPGLAVYVRARTGFDAWVVVVHLDSGRDDRAFERRARVYAAFSTLRGTLGRIQDDADVIVLGDFNTMGSDRGPSALDELASLERELDGASFRRLWLEPGCTEVSGRRVSMLDHVIVSTATAELAPSARAAVRGPCGRTRCRPERGDPWFEHISDHCPVVVTFDGRDLD